MTRKFVQLTPLAGADNETEFYAVADDGTAWYGCLDDAMEGSKISWTQVTPLPEKEKRSSKGLVPIKGLI
ncbi:hypothetical protein GGR41_000551 [Paenalcaligenes hominis]|uniref:Phage tail protein n=1 Tax=Paenalcaligenes hominis TaxID=643674 RepID=A0ABX0WM70_9BURK|nr:hypothetical protein [Paenalcaligenes hominis]NJB64330.1 hypothetical protein [Paenalcaligenes hominis]GGE68494.1 hypothetical protein GCM10007278_15710 [Paenalcaligenes hominis]